MTASALTRPGERDRLSTKITELDWRIVGLLCVVAGVGAAMLYSIAGGHWQPWAADHLIRFGAMLVIMLGLAMGCSALRIFLGPRAQDRVLGLDTLYVNALLLLLTFGIQTGKTLYFEASLIIALLGFVGTVGLAKFLMRGEVIE